MRDDGPHVIHAVHMPLALRYVHIVASVLGGSGGSDLEHLPVTGPAVGVVF
jgi:hypothetical protein